MTDTLDDHFLLRYRELLDAEDSAFDELEHASEDGNRTHFDAEMDLWRVSLSRKLQFLSKAGFDLATLH